ncbi:toll/interleukin-1 receptor domain-containing protein [Pseudovibrio sp. JE062]|uniref:toll/interleukin-1 receptor domain-containing protein n=1 Tax=Pseudovibrio sp. JE062 TaxID=439495 RepID=UPI000186BB5E|nr:toll/interleukin-1 receptor domain-containing protein [Pseudovibrio sp. JE062]EEA95677.1 TIR [Pseudovibrio sp. JE062]
MAAKLFFSYSHKDEALRDELEVQLAMMKRRSEIENWHDRCIMPGASFDKSIDENLNAADIILMLVSPDFLASDYCYDIEVQRALERHNEGSAHAVAVILRPCDWQHPPLSQYLALPQDGKPVTKWADRDEVLLHIVKELRRLIDTMPAKSSAAAEIVIPDELEIKSAEAAILAPLRSARSSNLRVAKTFSEADIDGFVDEAFEYLLSYFQNSLSELEARYPQISSRLRRIDANVFTATLYENGQKVSACSIFRNSFMGNKTIALNNSDNGDNSSLNHWFSAQTDKHNIYFQSSGFSGGQAQKLTMEGVAEDCWAGLISVLQ